MALHLFITGRVQGVGFRYSLRAEARRLGAGGWVRNRRDGSVEAIIEGSPQAQAALVAWARRGPPGARVDAVQENTVPDSGIKGFEERATEKQGEQRGTE